MVNAINIQAIFNGKQAFEGLTKLEKSFNRFKKVVTGVLAGKMVKQAAEFGKQMSLMSDRVGMSVAKLTALKGAFTSAGAGAKGFEKTINNISSGLLGISRGRGEFAAKLGMLGLSPYGADGQLKSPDSVLYDIADWAKGQKDSGMMSEQDIMYLLMSEFGFDEATAKMAMGGSQAIKDESERAKREGRTLGDEETNSLTRIAKSISEMFETINTAFYRFIAPLEPVITGFMDGLKSIGEAINVLIGPMRENSEEIKMLGSAIGSVLGFIIKAIAGLINVIAGVIYKVGELIGTALASIGILADKISGAWGWLKKLFGFDGSDEKKEGKPLTEGDFKEVVGENGKTSYVWSDTPQNLEQATNTGNNGVNVEDNTKIEVVVQGNMDSETYERMKTEFPQDKYKWVKEDMSG